MIKEAYCSKEVSILLKEKGFNEATNRHYNAQYDEIRTVSDTFMTYWNNEEHMKVLMMEGALAIPTHQMAMAWLREVHNIFIVIEPHMYDYINEKNSSYVISLWQGDNYSENITSKDYPTYEEAVEAALKYSLENLI